MSDPLTVLITNARAAGGGEARYVSNLAAELRKAGHRVLIGCKPGSTVAEYCRAVGVTVLDQFTFRGGLRPRAWTHDLALMRDVLVKERPGVIHVNSSQDHWIAGIAHRRLGRPSCLVRTRHNTYAVANSWPNRVLNRDWTDFQIIVCRHMRAEFAKEPAFAAQPMASVHNGVDAEAYRPDPALRAQARNEFGYTDNEIVIGIAARVNPIKGHEYLLRAVSRLKADVPNLRVLLLGGGDLEPELKRLAQELGIAGLATFAGNREDMARCVQAFDIGAQPSLEETSSFSLKEQMACEKPVITSDYPACLEIVEDGVEGYTVPVRSVEPLADAIRRLATDAGLRARMGRAGRERVLREFSIEEFGRRTLDAYGQAIESARAARNR